MRHLPGGAGVRASAHPPDAQRRGLAHGGLPLLAACLVQCGKPQLGCRLRLSARLSARLGAHLAHLGKCFSIMTGMAYVGTTSLPSL